MKYANVTVDMIAAAQKGSKQARDAACMGVYALTVQIAGRIARAYGQDPADLVQAGILGALEGIDKFDPLRGIKPSTYLTWHIRRRIFELARKQSSMIKGPSTDGASKVHYNGRKVRARIVAQKGECDTVDLARALGVDVATVAAVEAAGQPMASLSATVGDKGSLEATLADDSPDPEACVVDAQRKAWTAALLADFGEGLTDNERGVFDLRINTANPLPGRLVGDMLDMTRQGVSLIEIRLRERLEKRIKLRLG